MQKSQLNSMSKREILEGLLRQQNQDVANINRLVIALAMTLDVDAKKFAKNFADLDDNQKFALDFNAALQEAFAAKQKEAEAKSTEQSEEKIAE